jgi:hypothetical protein
MPNWCSNTITISSDEPGKLKEFVDFLEEKNGKEWFNFFLPTPEELQENGWYEWNVENWGTKWNPDAQDWSVDEDFTTVSFWFDSAWAPPTKLYEFITQNTDFDISAEYSEEGMGFVGRFVDGEDEYYEYDCDDLISLEDIPEDLLENWGIREMVEDRLDEDDDNLEFDRP